MQTALPEKFKKRMQEMLGDEYAAYEESLNHPCKSGIRLNTLKLNAEQFRAISGFQLKKIDWIDNAFYYGEEDVPSKHPYYYAGLYYIQEPSAMTPAFLFDVEPGDRVLDLCAAPGGKSTALAAKLQGKGILVSNDVSNSRAKALLKNIELFGVRNAVVISETPAKLAERFYGYFDKILVDAPCSGEGMFRKQPSIMKNWEQYGTEYYAKLQREILPEAVKMLRPGGKLLYSTCTFSPLEDEETAAFLLEQFPELTITDLFPAEKKEQYSKMGFDHGHAEWMERPVKGIEKAVRLWPHKLDGEGHFMVVFEKAADSQEPQAQPAVVKDAKESEEFREFMKQLSADFGDSSLVYKDDRYYMVPNGLPELKGLRILRNGLLMGEQKKGRFEPSQALACALKCGEYANVYNLTADHSDVIRYLKCESIDIGDAKVKDGYVLVACDGYSLGFGKLKNGSFKNKYLPGWRLM